MPRCMICAKTEHETGASLRVNDYGQPGVWTCDAHAAQALRAFAKAKGVDAVRPDLRKHVEKPGP